MANTNDGTEKVTVTLKADSGYDSPWIVFKGGSPAEVADLIGTSEAIGLYAIVGNARASFTGQATAGQVLGAQPVTHPATAQAEYAPQQAATPPQGYVPPQAQPQYQPQAQPPQGAASGAPVKTCPHGQKSYKTSAPNAAKTWAGYFCPAAKGDPSQCPVEWQNNR